MALKAHNGQVQVMQIFKYLPQTITFRHLEEEKARIDSIYQAIRNQPGLDFSALVERYSDDRQSRWIEGLQTTVEFENIASSLPVGIWNACHTGIQWAGKLTKGGFFFILFF